jgi:nucleotide-binding universal stress UspA family protein
MATKIIVSYDGTDSDRDALALGRTLARAGAALALAYVRHQKETGGREALAEHEAEALLEGGAAWLGDPDVPRFVVLSASTPQGLKELAVNEEADAIVFGSAYRTTPGHVIRRRRPSGSWRAGPRGRRRPPATSTPPTRRSRRSPGRRGTRARADCRGPRRQARATVEDRPSHGAGLLVVGSKAPAVHGTVLLSAASAYVIELAMPAIVLPRGAAGVLVARRPRVPLRAVPEAFQHLGRGGVCSEHHHRLPASRLRETAMFAMFTPASPAASRRGRSRRDVVVAEHDHARASSISTSKPSADRATAGSRRSSSATRDPRPTPRSVGVVARRAVPLLDHLDPASAATAARSRS